MLKVVHDDSEPNATIGTESGLSLLDEIVRDGARQMLAAALRAEVAAYIEAHAHEADENGHRLVVRNGYHAEWEVTTAAGAVPVRQSRVNDRRVDPATGERKRFASAILPAWARQSPQVSEVLPLLYLHGLSTSDFAPALEQFLGTGHGLSAATVTRLTKDWQGEATAFGQRGVFADTREQRCWWHKIGNVLAALPKSAHKDAKAALAEIYNAEDRDHAEQAAKAFAAAYGAKWPKAVAKITNDLDVLLAFYDFPGEHWIHLRTTNPIESTFATVRLRQRVTKGPGSRAAGIAMAFKLIESAQHRWRAVNSAHLVALVRAGAKFENGVLVERPDESTSGDTHAA